jgi:SAM-dependent methyltransferase
MIMVGTSKNTSEIVPNSNPYVPLICPKHKLALNLIKTNDDLSLVCKGGCSYAIRGNIPRFLTTEDYATSFGLQWNKFRTTQLDSFTGLTISKDRLIRLVGGDLSIVAGKNVLEAGCGAGRFTECLLKAGAKVFAVDLSSAVEANFQNCRQYPDYFVCQADILALPVAPEQFDIVICVGVVQHTQSPEKTMSALCSYVKPGGILVMDHYTQGYPITPSRRILRAFLIKMSPAFSMRFCRIMKNVLWPIHRLLAWGRKIPGIGRLRSIFLHLSPIVDYHDAYGQIGPKLLNEWALLDTHDTLTDYYKHLRSADELRAHLQKCGMEEISTTYAGNGVEVMARKPFPAEKSMVTGTK